MMLILRMSYGNKDIKQTIFWREEDGQEITINSNNYDVRYTDV